MLATLLLAASLAAGDPPTLAWPLEIDDGLSASFGEQRGDRVHTGIDLRTRREVGLAVRAVAAGRVVRLKEQWRGYGLAVYVEHPGGLVTVYAHLDRVVPELEARLAKARRRRGSRWAGNLTVEPPWPLRREQVFAYSGESGAGHPHLHFEVRRGMSTPVDPFAAGLARPRDPEPPLPSSLVIEPAALGSTVDGSGEAREYRLERQPSGAWAPLTVPQVDGPVRLLLAAHDTAGASNRAGLGALDVRLDGEPLYRLAFERIPFGRQHSAGTFLELSRSGLSPTEYTYRLTALDGAEVPFVHGSDGPLRLDPGSHRLEVELAGASGVDRPTTRVVVPLVAMAAAASAASDGDLLADPGVTELDVVARGDGVRIRASATGAARIRLDDEPHQLVRDGAHWVAESALAPGRHSVSAGATSLPFTVARLGPGRTRLRHGPLRLDVPAGAAWAPLTIVARTVAVDLPDGLVALSDGVRVGPEAHPLRREARVRFETTADLARAAVFRHDPRRDRWTCVDLGAGADVRRLSAFVLVDDRARPEIGEIRPTGGERVAAGATTIEVEATDERGCGLPEHGVRIWVDDVELDELYDPDRDRARATWRATPGEHRLRVRVEDYAGNHSERVLRFTVDGT